MTEIMNVRRVPTWSRVGEDVSQSKTMEQVLAASGLDYTVTKVPVFADIGVKDMELQPMANRFATMRSSDGHLYDVVSDKFEIIQNKDAFSFVDYMGEGGLVFEKAGETASGMVFVIGRLPEVTILGDTFTPHVVFRNGFSGKVKITAAICPLRVVCQNQFNFAFKNSSNTVTVRHVQNAERKLEEAREVLKLSANYMQELSAMAETYATKKLSPRALEWVLNAMFPMGNPDTLNGFAKKRLEMARAEFTAAYEADDNRNFRGTAWGMINAYTDFLTHREAMGNTDTKEEGKFTRVTFGKPMNNIIEIVDGIVA